MSRDSVGKKLQRKAARRAGRKLPTEEAKDSPKGHPGSESGFQEQVEYSAEFLEYIGVVSSRANPDGTVSYFSEEGPIHQSMIDSALEKWRLSQDEESE